MRYIVGMDPAPSSVAAVLYDRTADAIVWRMHDNTADVCSHLPAETELVAVEMPVCYGAVAGWSLFETCVTVGRVIEAVSGKFNVRRVGRRPAMRELGIRGKGSDARLREYLVRRYDGRAEMLHSVRGDNDIRAAIGIALAVSSALDRDPDIASWPREPMLPKRVIQPVDADLFGTEHVVK